MPWRESRRSGTARECARGSAALGRGHQPRLQQASRPHSARGAIHGPRVLGRFRCGPETCDQFMIPFQRCRRPGSRAAIVAISMALSRDDRGEMGPGLDARNGQCEMPKAALALRATSVGCSKLVLSIARRGRSVLLNATVGEIVVLVGRNDRRAWLRAHRVVNRNPRPARVCRYSF